MNFNLGELVARAAAGEEKAFEEIYKRLFTPLFRYIYFRVKDTEEAKDLTQSVFLKIYQALPRADGQMNFMPYVFTIARNTIIDHWRRKKNFFLSEEETGDKNAGLAYDPFEKKELGEAVRAALETLPEAQAEAVTLKFIAGLKNREIAATLDKNEEAVRQLQFRGLEKLRKYFEENEIL